MPDNPLVTCLEDIAIQAAEKIQQEYDAPELANEHLNKSIEVIEEVKETVKKNNK